MQRQLYLCASLLLVLLWQTQIAVAEPDPENSPSVPQTIALRMVPSWWSPDLDIQECDAEGDCGKGKCCAWPLMSRRAFCKPFMDLGQPCLPYSHVINFNDKVYMNTCPCLQHLTCANVNNTSICVDPKKVNY
ncbi:unnamed protein product [Meganyctiphanes norvegica]|uniref:Prokineticin domain-containing protein n=1 Tax=Meganyctiphanes norvegica TaxID=48144 RepID=A0AAV2Q0S5_MEGNR